MWEERMKMILNEYRLLPFQKEAQAARRQAHGRVLLRRATRRCRPGTCPRNNRLRSDTWPTATREPAGLGVRTTAAFFGHPARPLHAVLQRDVGALLATTGCAAFLILYMTAPRRHRRHRAGRRRRPRRSTASTPRWCTCEPAGRLGRRPRARPAQCRALRRHPDRAAATSRSRFRSRGTFYLGPDADRARHRTAQAEHQRHRRPALRAEGRRAATPAFSIFYMGINLGAFLGPLITGYLAQDEGSARDRRAGAWIRTPRGTGASAPPASA